MNAPVFDVEKAISQAMGQPAPKPVPFMSGNPSTDKETFADDIRNFAANCEQRIAHNKRVKRDTVATLEAQKKAEKARHELRMAELAEAISAAKAASDEAISADQESVKMAKAALAVAE
jgi:hypothetical protein